MAEFTLSINDAEYVRAIERTRLVAMRKVELMFYTIGGEVVAFLKSATNETRPGVRPGEPNRRAHPGGWADVTANLANAYRYTVTVDAEGVTLTFFNDMEYAAVLEARDGYFVLRGVTGPGGPLEKALRAVIPRVAPGWTVV